MLPRNLVTTVSILALLWPAASLAQGTQPKDQPPQSQAQERQAQGQQKSQAQQSQGQQQSMDKAQRRQIEERLKAAGFNPGPVDGVFTGETAQALVAYEKARGLPSEGLLIPIAEPTRQALMAEQPGRGQTQTQAQGDAKQLQVVGASTLRDMPVKNQQGETIGEIERVMFDLEDGRVAYVILDFDGWFDVGGRHIAAPWEALKLAPGAREVSLTVDKEKLQKAPGFAPNAWPTAVERPWLTDVYTYYGYQPYPALRTRATDRFDVASAESLIDRDVENRQGNDFGEIADLAVDLSNGRIAYAMLEYGGWLGLGEQLAAVPWKSLQADAATRQFTLDVNTDQLKTLPSFAREEWPQKLDREWLANVYSRYGEKPYWQTN
jgi:sporulation protein YlmC with PRC-barrel domain